MKKSVFKNNVFQTRAFQNRTFRNRVLRHSSFLSVLLLSACGGTGQDDGKISTFNQEITGRSIDGYLARSLVFLDSNNNGTRDAWESMAFTDNEGYFSYNPISERNYCSEGASAQEQQYCLKTNIEYDDVVLRIDGGVDVSTGEPFLGQLSRRIQLTGNAISTLVTPLSSLLSSVQSEEGRTQLLEKLSLSDGALDLDYFDLLTQNRPDLVNINLKLHKAITIFDDFLMDNYQKIGDRFGTPNDASLFVYRTLAEKIISADNTAANTLNSETLLIEVLQEAETYLRDIYTTKEFSIPQRLTSDALRQVVAVATDIGGIVDRLINPQAGALGEQALLGSVRALEVLTSKAVRGLSASDLENAIAFFNSNEGAELIQGLVSALGNDDFNLPALFQSSFVGDSFSSVESLQTLARFGDTVVPFQEIAGKQIKVSDRVKDTNPSDLEDKEFEFYFHGEAGATSGAFTACAKFVDDASLNADGTLSLGEGNVEGELVSGFWSLLGANADNNFSSYSLLLTIDFLGTTYQTIMKPGSNLSLPDGYSERIRFDTADGIVDWFSATGFETINVEPENDEACQQRLESRLL